VGVLLVTMMMVAAVVLRVAPLKVGLKVVMRLMAVQKVGQKVAYKVVLRLAATPPMLSTNPWGGARLQILKPPRKHLLAYLNPASFLLRCKPRLTL